MSSLYAQNALTFRIPFINALSIDVVTQHSSRCIEQIRIFIKNLAVIFSSFNFSNCIHNSYTRPNRDQHEHEKKFGTGNTLFRCLSHVFYDSTFSTASNWVFLLLMSNICNKWVYSM